MSQVSMTINGRVYRLNCEDGDEERLLQLAADVGARVDEFANSFGQVGENRLLLLAGLRLADELLDARAPAAQNGANGSAAKKRPGKRRKTAAALSEERDDADVVALEAAALEAAALDADSAADVAQSDHDGVEPELDLVSENVAS